MTGADEDGLRIAVVHHRSGGGATRAAWDLVAGLRARGHELRIWPAPEESGPAKSEAVALQALAHEVEAFAPDLIHAHCWYGSYPLEALLALARDASGRRRPIFWTAHDPALVNTAGDECWECYRHPSCLGCPALPVWKAWRPNLRVRARWRRARFLARLATEAEFSAIYPSEWMRRRYSRTRLGRLAGHVVPYGLPLDARVPAPAAFEERDPATVLFAGHMYAASDHRKGLPELLAAWPRVLADHPAARLVVAGRVPTEIQAPPQTEILGEVDGEALATWLRRASLFCLPSRGDNSPLAVLEAMAAGLPVVATEVGGIPEQVGAVNDPDAAGRLVAPRNAEALAEALSRSLADCEWRRAAARAGPVRIQQRFLASAGVDRHLELFRAALLANLGAV